MMKLDEMGLLGSYPANERGQIQLEYQIGRRLIWVLCPSTMPEQTCVELADAVLDEAMGAIPQAVALAEQVSRRAIPEFWRDHDESGIKGSRLDAWSVTIVPDDGRVQYDISANHDFWHTRETRDLPDYPDGELICVDRSASGVMSICPR